MHTQPVVYKYAKWYTNPTWQLYTFIMGFITHEKKRPAPPNGERAILSVGE